LGNPIRLGVFWGKRQELGGQAGVVPQTSKGFFVGGVGKLGTFSIVDKEKHHKVGTPQGEKAV